MVAKELANTVVTAQPAICFISMNNVGSPYPIPTIVPISTQPPVPTTPPPTCGNLPPAPPATTSPQPLTSRLPAKPPQKPPLLPPPQKKFGQIKKGCNF